MPVKRTTSIEHAENAIEAKEREIDYKDALRAELDSVEGTKTSLHLDNKDFPTLGSGHLVTDKTPEILSAIGVSDEVISKFNDSIKNIKDKEEIDIGLTDQNRQDLRDYSINEKENLIRSLIPAFDSLPDSLKTQLMSSAYLGGITASENTIKLINAGEWEKASKEFLDHDEYKKYKASGEAEGIVNRMEALSAELLKMVK